MREALIKKGRNRAVLRYFLITTVKAEIVSFCDRH